MCRCSARRCAPLPAHASLRDLHCGCRSRPCSFAGSSPIAGRGARFVGRPMLDLEIALDADVLPEMIAASLTDFVLVPSREAWRDPETDWWRASGRRSSPPTSQSWSRGSARWLLVLRPDSLRGGCLRRAQPVRVEPGATWCLGAYSLPGACWRGAPAAYVLTEKTAIVIIACSPCLADPVPSAVQWGGLCSTS